MNILALSSSRTGNSGYLETARPWIKESLGNDPVTIAFIPFASVGSQDEYLQKVSEALRPLLYNIQMVTLENAFELITACDAVMTGGGNTFKLLHDLYKSEVLTLIRERVKEGLPYVGWSAGANILGPTICTTNDMPIIKPRSFEALNVLPFQINPHYYNSRIEGFNGETRDRRLEEFLRLNPDKKVIGLPEGSAMLISGEHPVYRGQQRGVLFFASQDGTIQKTIIEDGWVYEK